ncbi:hypothetical protein [Clostridium sp.]|uniref:hypothetical protein n=1 Tax=Clostridium sp. TaxID=1506 RepID=UPI003463CA83
MVSFMIKEINDKEKDKELWNYIEDKYKDIEEVEKHTYKGCRNHKDFSYTKIISRSEAMEDIIILFRAILYNFKGIEIVKDIFRDIKTSILKELNNIESITNYDFENIVVNILVLMGLLLCHLKKIIITIVKNMNF